MDNIEEIKTKRAEKSIEELLDDDMLFTNYEGKDLFLASEIKEILGIPITITTHLFEPASLVSINGLESKKYYYKKEIEDALENQKNEKHDILIKMLKEYKNRQTK